MDYNGDNTSKFSSQLPAIVANAGGLPRNQGRRLNRITLAAFALLVGGLFVTLPGRNNDIPSVSNETDHMSASSERSASVSGGKGHFNSSAPHLVVSAPPVVLQSDEPVALGLAIDGAPDGAQLVIGGFATGSLFSVGQSIGQYAWIIPASQVKTAAITPPRGFVGAMDIAMMLVSPNGSPADRTTLHLEWLSPMFGLRPSASSVPRRIEPSEVNALLMRGNALEATGDLAGARLLFRRAAEAGNARAAFMLAETYDPIVLENLGELGLASNVAIARIWYGKAKDLGSAEAADRLERLAHAARFPRAVAADP